MPLASPTWQQRSLKTNNGFGSRSSGFGNRSGGGRSSDRAPKPVADKTASPDGEFEEYTRSSTTRLARSAPARAAAARELERPNAGQTDADEFVHQAVSPSNKKQGPSLKARAVGYLSRREHSRQELGRKLATYAESPDEVEPVLASLEKDGWLSTERFTQSLVHRRAPGQGVARIVQELKQHGVDAKQIADVKQSLQASEFGRAREVWARRYGDPPADAQARAKQTRFLMSRGFSYDVIRKVLSGAGAAEDDLD